MTARQRIRLILGLGVLNLVLATIALGIGGRNSSSVPQRPQGPSPSHPAARRRHRSHDGTRDAGSDHAVAGRDPVSATTQHRSDRRESVAVDRGQPGRLADPGRDADRAHAGGDRHARRHARADGRAEHRPDPGAHLAVNAGPDGTATPAPTPGHTRADALRHARPDAKAGRHTRADAEAGRPQPEPDPQAEAPPPKAPKVKAPVSVGRRSGSGQEQGHRIQ